VVDRIRTLTGYQEVFGEPEPEQPTAKGLGVITDDAPLNRTVMIVSVRLNRPTAPAIFAGGRIGRYIPRPQS
jgi:hypothetical protein